MEEAIQPEINEGWALCAALAPPYSMTAYLFFTIEVKEHP
jgi:hypothetical protein